MTRRKSEPVFYRNVGGQRARDLEGTQLASFRARAWAFTLDLLIVLLLVILVGLPRALKNRAHDPTGHLIVHFEPFHGISGGLVALVVYFGFATYLGRGQTLGKRLLRIRVISLVHDHLSLLHCVERALGYGASALEGGFGFLQFFTHPNRQTVHDRIAETIVVAASSSSADAAQPVTEDNSCNESV